MKRIIDYVENIDPNFRRGEYWYTGIKRSSGIRIKEYEIKKGRECQYYRYWPINSKEVALKIQELLKEEGFKAHTNDEIVSEEYGKNKRYYIYVFSSRNR
ncbi:MAG: hypothetical protein J5716_07780 [Alphaproteobacteria bacterium]|nr:hypothetical protein [Alphaproteobacteria bacterium]